MGNEFLDEREIRRIAQESLPAAAEVLASIAQGKPLPGCYRLRGSSILSACKFIVQLSQAPQAAAALTSRDKQHLEKVSKRYTLSLEERNHLDRLLDVIARDVPRLVPLGRLLCFDRGAYEHLSHDNQAQVRQVLGVLVETGVAAADSLPEAWLDCGYDDRIELLLDTAIKSRDKEAKKRKSVAL